MTYKLIESPIELTDDQLDMVAAAGNEQTGLINIDDTLNKNDVAVAVGVLSNDTEAEAG